MPAKKKYATHTTTPEVEVAEPTSTLPELGSIHSLLIGSGVTVILLAIHGSSALVARTDQPTLLWSKIDALTPVE